MNNRMKKTVAAVVITASLLSSAYTAFADDAVNTGVTDGAQLTAVTYALTDQLDVEVTSVLNERVSDGTRLGVVVRMKNNGTKVTRVPDYEVRVKTDEGIEYTLQPSASNAKSVQPKASTELSYMSVIDRTDEFTLAEVNWTDVDEYVYPKKEMVIVSAPINDKVWKGSDMPITEPAALKKWTDTFQIPSLESPIQYTPKEVSKEYTQQGTVYVVQLLAYNPTDKREIVPDFTIDGVADGKVYSGSMVEQSGLTLEAQEAKYVHLAVPTDPETVLTSFNVLTPEKYVQAAAGGAPSVVNYKVGRLNILLPSDTQAGQYPEYTLGSPMQFDPHSELIHPDMDVSVVEFNMSPNAQEGTQNVTAKFKLLNKTDRPMAVPVFQTDLVSQDGYTYSGSRQSMQTQSILPNSAITVNYSFTVPASETGKGLALKIEDAKTAAPYKETIAAYSMQLQEQDIFTHEITVYPFTFKVDYSSIIASFSMASPTPYSYKAKFDFDIKREDNVQLDPAFSKLLFELYDSSDRLIGSATGSFTGMNRLVSGENNIYFNATTEQFDHPLTVRMYEVFTTAAGDSKRLLGEFKQP